MLEPQWTAKDI